MREWGYEIWNVCATEESGAVNCCTMTSTEILPWIIEKCEILLLSNWAGEISHFHLL